MKYLSLIGAGLGVLFTPVAIGLSLKSAQQGDLYWAGIFFPLLTIALLKGAGPVVLLAFVQYLCIPDDASSKNTMFAWV